MPVRNPKSEGPPFFGIRHSDFVRISDFGLRICVHALLLLTCLSVSAAASYTNYFLPGVKTNSGKAVHVVQLDRRLGDWQFRPVLANTTYNGLSTLRELIAFSTNWGVPLAAINGDFFQRRGYVPGDPRGLMIQDGEMVSAPESGVAFWIYADARWHLGIVRTHLTVTWPSGQVERIGLNEELRASRPALYTAADGPATPPIRRLLARELVLEYGGQGPWLPLRAGKNYTVRVRAVLDTGATPLHPNSMVLSVSTNWLAKSRLPLPGMVLKISTRTEPDVSDAVMAIGGGPLVLVQGERQPTYPKPKRKGLPASVTHIWERHPRSAIGWNRDYFFLVAVDGRLPGLSEGMTIKELATFMKNTLGCAEAMNLDGGGSATLWYDGQVRNVPSDGEERPVANALMIWPGRQP